jgi:hypothetical protein
MNNFDEELSALQAEAEMLVWMLERMGHSKACELCGTPTAPSDLIESRVRTIRRLDMGAGIGQVGDGTGITSIWLCPTCPVP